MKAFRIVNPPSLIGQGRPRSLTREYEEAIEDFLDEYSQVYLNEIIVFIWDEFDINVARNTMSRAIKRIKLIYKRVEPVYRDQEDDLRVR